MLWANVPEPNSGWHSTDWVFSNRIQAIDIVLSIVIFYILNVKMCVCYIG